MEILIYKGIIITLSVIAAFIAFKGFFYTLHMLEKYNAIFNKKTLLKEANIQAQHIKKTQNKSTNEQISLLQEELYEHLETTKQEIEIQQNQIEEKKLLLEQECKKILAFEHTFDNKKQDLLEKNKITLELKDSFDKIEHKHIESLAAKAQVEYTTIINKINQKQVSQAHLEIQKDQKNHLEELQSSLPKSAKKIIHRSLSRYFPEFIWPKPSSIVEVDQKFFEYLDKSNTILEHLRQLSEVDIQLLTADEQIDSYRVKFAGGYGINKEAAKLTFTHIFEKRLKKENKIHPIFQNNFKKLEKEAKLLGGKAVKYLQLENIHPEIQKLVGALNWRSSYRQNQWHHTVEVATLAGLLANELGVDSQDAKRSGLLHDIGKVLDYDIEGSHAVISCDYADRYGEKRHICDAVLAHHSDLISETPLANILKAADTFSGARPGARVNIEEGYQIRISAIQEAVESFEGVIDISIMSGGREVHVQVNPREVTQEETPDLAKKIAKKIESDVTYPGQIKIIITRSFESHTIA
jgi:ribonucrease Y